jgi:hypothetical protein
MTGKGPAPVLGADMRAVRRELSGAGDQQVLKVLRYVDQLPDRSQADGLLAPLRDRLRRLRPPRPLCFARLLCMPLDAVIVDPRDWHAGTPQFPRSAITPIAALMERALPDILPAVQALIGDTGLPEACRAARVGALLWPRAATVPPEWQAAGLPPAAFAPLAHACALCLGAGSPIEGLDDPGIPEAELNRSLTAMLTGAESDGAIAWGMLLTVLLQRFPHAEAPRRLRDAGGSRRPAGG